MFTGLCQHALLGLGWWIARERDDFWEGFGQHRRLILMLLCACSKRSIENSRECVSLRWAVNDRDAFCRTRWRRCSDVYTALASLWPTPRMCMTSYVVFICLITPCHANLHKWGFAASELCEFCDCGQQQTVGHIVASSPLTQLNGGLMRLCEADDDAINWLKTVVATALTKWITPVAQITTEQHLCSAVHHCLTVLKCVLACMAVGHSQSLTRWLSVLYHIRCVMLQSTWQPLHNFYLKDTLLLELLTHFVHCKCRCNALHKLTSLATYFLSSVTGSFIRHVLSTAVVVCFRDEHNRLEEQRRLLDQEMEVVLQQRKAAEELAKVW